MKSIKIFTLIVLGLWCIHGCSNIDSIENAPSNQKEDFGLNEGEIIELASYYISLFEGEDNPTRTSSTDYIFETKYYDDSGVEYNHATRALSSNETFPITELSIKDNGSASSMFLCTDKRYPGLIAYIPSTDLGERDASDNIYFNSALQSFLVERQLIEAEAVTRAGYNPETWPSGQVWGGVYPLLYTNWAHDSPYNLFKPTNSAGKNVNLSSATVAIVQLLAFMDIQLIGYIYPSDWTYLYQNERIYETDPSIKKEFISDMMITVENHLNSGITKADGTLFVDQAVWGRFFNDLFYTTNVNTLRLGYNQVLSSLDQFRMVHTMGENGDEIVDCALIDGYLKVKNQYPQGYEIYWHINPAYTNGTGYYFFSTTSTAGDYYVYDPTRSMYIWNISVSAGLREKKGILVPPEHA